jgi:ApaG protein
MTNKKLNSIVIGVSAEPNYIAEQSDPTNQKFVWSYEITIINESVEIVQLLHRYWRITDMTGKIEEIYGAGVIGLQPLIKPKNQFIYTSFCQLSTPQGTMEGHYEMQNLEEEHFNIEIPKFILSAPTAITRTFRSKLH